MSEHTRAKTVTEQLQETFSGTPVIVTVTRELSISVTASGFAQDCHLLIPRDVSHKGHLAPLQNDLLDL